MTDLKHFRPISLLSCLGKMFEKILAASIAVAARATGALTDEQFGLLAHRSWIDALIMNLTDTQEWVLMANTHKTPALRPTFLANDGNGTFNCMVHDKLTEIWTLFNFPRHVVTAVRNFSQDRLIFPAFDGEHKQSTPFKAGLPQGSPLSPILLSYTLQQLASPANSPNSNKIPHTWTMKL